MYLSDKKKRFCNELEEAIKMLVHKLFSIIKELEKLINTGTWRFFGCFHNYFNFRRVRDFHFTLS